MKIGRIFITALMVLLLLPIGGCAVSSTTERTGLVTMRGQPITLQGDPIYVGETAPTFQAVTNDMTVYNFQPGQGKVWILSSVPSLDTRVCSLETRHFNQVAPSLGNNVGIITISMDLPFAQKQWCGDEGIKHVQTLSDYRFHSFANAYGVLMEQNGLLARQVVVIGKDSKITYIQLVPDISHEPDYAAVLAAVRETAMAQ